MINQYKDEQKRISEE